MSSGSHAAPGAGESAPPRPRQLRMQRPVLDGLPPLVCPEGFALRTYRAGDEAHWAAIMGSEAGIGTGWTVEKVRASMIERPQFAADGLFFATAAAGGARPADGAHPASGAGDDRPVASAAAWRVPPEERVSGYVHMVCALPAYRGRGLGRLVTLAVLHYLRDHGFARAILETDDWRLPAIRSYLGLGFTPVYVDDPQSDHRLRWSGVFARLFARPDASAGGAP